MRSTESKPPCSLTIWASLAVTYLRRESSDVRCEQMLKQWSLMLLGELDGRGANGVRNGVAGRP